MLLDDFANIGAFYSFGIGTQIEFDEEISARGIPVYMFDHTIDSIPRSGPNMFFHRYGIGGTNEPAQGIYTLEHYVEWLGHLDRNDLATKIDVEGAEFAALNGTSEEILCKFRQIVIEVHWLSNLQDPDYRNAFIQTFTKLNRLFTLCHVHANNCAEVKIIDGFSVADVLELTYIRSDLVKAGPSSTIYPTSLDAANAHWAADHLLWFYPFMPLSSDVAAQLRSSYVGAESVLREYRGQRAVVTANERDFAERMLEKKNIIDSDVKTRSLKILYFGCHEILEYDDLSMFTEAGHKVFSLGAFTFRRDSDKCEYRTADPAFYDADLERVFEETGCSVPNKMVSKEFAELFDVVIINHYPEWIHCNMDAFRNVPVIVRTIGQSRASTEAAYQRLGSGISIVRYSPREVGLPGFAKTDDVIYFAKSNNGYSKWKGGRKGLTFHNGFTARDIFGMPKLEDWMKVANEVPMVLHGAHNNNLSFSKGLARPDRVGKLMANAAFYFYVYTCPPSYTLSLIEAMAAGMPIIAPSAAMANFDLVDNFQEFCWVPERYEVPSFLEGVGLIYDSVEEAVALAKKVANDGVFAESLSSLAAARAESLFSPPQIAAKWRTLFERVL